MIYLLSQFTNLIKNHKGWDRATCVFVLVVEGGGGAVVPMSMVVVV